MPARKMREKSVVAAIVKAVKRTYPLAYVRKFADRYTRGLPDLLIAFRAGCRQGGTLFVEVKTDSGRLSAIQGQEHLEILAAGGTVLVATSPDEVLTRLHDMGAVP